MGYPTKVQLIQRKRSNQWYVGFPAALAAALGLKKSEIVEWRVEDRETLVLTRKREPEMGNGSGSTKESRESQGAEESDLPLAVTDHLQKG